MKKTLFVLAIVSALGACATSPQTSEITSVSPDVVVPRIGKNNASMVVIHASVIRPRPIYDTEAQWMHEFFPRISPSPRSHESTVLENLGTGIIISSDGLILANAHVILGAQEITVRVKGRDEPYSAQVIGIDRFTDVALLKINAIDMPVASLGRSERLKVGEWVAAIGSISDSSKLISAGIIRARTLDESFIPFIRTDNISNQATTNGPLVNANGEVVGISSGVVRRGAADLHSAFAVPIEVALDIAHHLRAYGEVRRGRLGIRVEELSRGLAEAINFPHDGGLVVSAVTRGGPADRAGVAVGDVILQINDSRIHGPLDFPRNAVNIEPGTPIKLRVWRRGSVRDITAVVEAPNHSARRNNNFLHNS